jgi:tetratricopeptide (TPR) repeat protein
MNRNFTSCGLLLALCCLCALLLSPRLLHANEPYSLNEHAISLLEKGEHDKALELLQKAFSLSPYDPVLKRNLAEAYTFVGQRQMRDKDFEAAAASFDRARELFPDEPRYYVNMQMLQKMNLRGLEVWAAIRRTFSITWRKSTTTMTISSRRLNFWKRQSN